MKEEINKLGRSIIEDYSRWAARAFDCNFNKVNDFRDSIEVKEGSKYIKIMHGNTVWGFVNKGNPDFEAGDILKAASWRAPALNKARGNIFGRYSVAWTGPHYISGYTAGGKRAPEGKTGLLRGNSQTVDGGES